MAGQLSTLELMGMELAAIDHAQLLNHMFSALRAGRGGWIVTVNLDFLRKFVREPGMRELYSAADLRVADGMPLLWAARLQGDAFPERVPGSSLVWLIAERAATEGRSIYLLGGAEDAGAGASVKLKERWPALRITGCSSPWVSNPPTAPQLETLRAELAAHPADIVLVAFGSPKQEHVIHALRPHFPKTWMMGVGISLSFVAGHVARAPEWLQLSGFEWIHRLVQEPRRLARRYLVEDLPFSFELFLRSFASRRARKKR